MRTERKMYTDPSSALPSTPPDREPRVLHLTLSFERGGRRDAILTLAREMTPLGITSSVATLRGEASLLEPFGESFAHRRSLDLTGRPTLRAILQLRRWCRDWGIEVVHTHDAASQFVASMLRIVAPTLHPIMTFHRSLGFESARYRDRLRNAVSLTLVDRVLTASEDRRHHFLGENLISPNKVQVIPLGIDLERFRPDPAARASARAELGVGPEAPLLLVMGHFGEEKGVAEAIQAAALAMADPAHQSTRLLVLGTGQPDRQALIETLGAELLGDRVTFGGHRPDPERWFRAADLFVHAPRVEAFGLVVVQAMASGTPVVAAGVGGIPEIVAEHRTGDLVTASTPERMGQIIAALLADPARRARYAAAGIEDARTRFAAARFAGDHHALYREITGRPPLPRG
jgi:glycosyltransferase involved in cell wall biosynthesis